MIKPGHFIVLEGLEGAGKTTALTTIYQFLTRLVPELITTREPGGTIAGEAVRSLVKTPRPEEPLDPRAELLLFYAARVQLLECVIVPALSRGAWVLADRFELSTFAYQGGGRKIDPTIINHLSSFCLRDVQPDLTIFLDIKPELGLKRAVMRGKMDRIEQESIEFFNDVYASYHMHINRMKNVHVIDASKPLRVVQRLIRVALKHYMTTHG